MGYPFTHSRSNSLPSVRCHNHYLYHYHYLNLNHNQPNVFFLFSFIFSIFIIPGLQITADDVARHENGQFNWIKATNAPYTDNYKMILATRHELPVFRQRQEFLDKYQKNRVVILSSDTGTGKTTEIPSLIHFNDGSRNMQVVCTQPRRTAATSVAARVAEVLDVKLGEEVGYRVRFDDKTTRNTRVVYATDGILLREFELDKLFSRYSCVIVDEAHERTVNSDILMGMLKHALTERNNLRVVIMSATLDAVKFQEYFTGSAFLHLTGQNQPLSINYLAGATPNYLRTAVNTVSHIHRQFDQGSDSPGHILVFLPGEDDIQNGCAVLRREFPGLRVLAFYSSLPRGEQQKVYLPVEKGKRKCVLSTNIAEASVTIPDIAYVVDTGLVKTLKYNPCIGLQMLETRPISKAAAQQRAARSGRTRPGTCFRLYTREAYDRSFASSTLPEIMYTCMTSLVLHLKGAGWEDVLRWPFVDDPAPELLFRALEQLNDMSLIDDSGILTRKGKQATKMTVDPAWFTAIDEGHKLGCSSDMITLAAVFSMQNSIFTRPWGMRAVAAQASTFFSHPHSEHLAHLHAMHAYARTEMQGSIDMDQWCRDHFVSRRAAEEALQLRKELVREWEVMVGPINSALWSVESEVNIRKALADSHYFGACADCVVCQQDHMLDSIRGVFDKPECWCVCSCEYVVAS